MSGAPSPLKWRVVARTPPTFTSTCSFTSPASQSTATTGSLSTSLLSTTPTTGTTRRLLLLILTGPGAMSPTRRLSPGTWAVPSTTRPSPLMVMAMVTATVSTTGAKVARDSASMVSPTWPGHSPGKDTLACTSSLASPRVWSTLSSILCQRVSPLSASGGDRAVTTGPPPTMSGMKALTSTAILEEQSIVPKATDETFKQKLYETHEKKNPAFVKPKVGKKTVAHFICKHYAGDVGYNLDGWLDKNKDPLNPSVVELLQKSKWDLIRVLFPAVEPEAPSGGKKKKKKKGGSMQTVGSLYRQQLNVLMTTLRSTKPSFVRCIVPNEIKTPAAVDNNLILHQLRCNGVLEGIRICRKGFPNRCQYPEFYQRYKILAAAQCGDIVDSKAASEIILKTIELPEPLYRIGKTKVFFKAGTLADLEEKRDEFLAVIITKLQARARGKLMRIEFLAMLARVRAARTIQNNIRKFLGFRDWGWWKLFTCVKPLLKNKEEEEAAKKKEAEMLEKMAQMEKDAGLLKDAEAKVAQLTKENKELALKLAAEEEISGDSAEQLKEMTMMKAQLDADLSEAHKDYEELEGKYGKLRKDFQKLEGDGATLADELATAGENFAKLQKEKQAADNKNKGLTSDLEARDASIASLQKDKKNLEQTNT